MTMAGDTTATSPLSPKKRKAIPGEDVQDAAIKSVSRAGSNTNVNKKHSEGKVKKHKLKHNEKKNGDTSASFSDDYESFSLDKIKSSILELCGRVPKISPDGIDPDDAVAIRAWAQSMQAVIEDFSLLLSCVSSATYKWGTDRSGAADQSLSLLSTELSLAQDQISSTCSTRLTNVLAPVVEVVVSSVVISKEEGTGKEIRTNNYKREQADPGFLQLCSTILCRNARMLRQVVLANFLKTVKVIEDFQKASKKDNQHDRGLSY